MINVKSDYLIEVVIDSVHSAIAAQEGGANRVELCDNLFEGGTTPSAGSIALTRSKIDLGLNVMIRPRGGDFLYSDLEFEIMKHDIELAKNLGADAVVFGILNSDGTVDKIRCSELLQIAQPLGATFHRAFDLTVDPIKALDDLIELGFDRILTSGCDDTALEGADLIAELVRQADEKIIIMPGGGIKLKNIKKIADITQCREFHLSARSVVSSQMEFRKSGVYMGGTLRPPEFDRYIADANILKQARQEIS